MDIGVGLGIGDRELVAFVGAGGKKTAMGRLVVEGVERGLAVGYTTTTHTPPPSDLPLVLTGEDSPLDALSGRESPVAFAVERVSDPDRAAVKVRGYDAPTVSDSFDSGHFDWLLVKADGARRREFKAPGSDEPVVPGAATQVVPVASVRAVGEPLDAPAVHRPERVAQITGLDVGEPVTPTAVGQVLGSWEGGLKGVPDGAEVTPVVNKADTAELREQARKSLSVALAEADRPTRGLVTSFDAGYCEVVER